MLHLLIAAMLPWECFEGIHAGVAVLPLQETLQTPLSSGIRSPIYELSSRIGQRILRNL